MKSFAAWLEALTEPVKQPEEGFASWSANWTEDDSAFSRWKQACIADPDFYERTHPTIVGAPVN